MLLFHPDTMTNMNRLKYKSLGYENAVQYQTFKYCQVLFSLKTFGLRKILFKFFTLKTDQIRLIRNRITKTFVSDVHDMNVNVYSECIQ